MSDRVGPPEIHKYIERLRKQSEPNSNDRRHAQYVKYINNFLAYFGDERVYLVGSTGENQKLRWSKDGGDADFILRSGKLKIPVDCIVHRDDTPCFVSVNCKDIDLTKLDIEPIEGVFLPSSSLRKVDPELFTIIRGLYTVVTSTSDNVPGRHTRVVTTGVGSKVGLARSEYRGLEIVQRDFHPNTRSKPIRNLIKKPPRSDEINPRDMSQLETMLKLIADQKLPKSTGNHAGKGLNFAHTVNEVMKRRQFRASVTDDGEAQTFDNDLDEGQAGPAKIAKHDQGTDLPETVSIKYLEKTSKDFVPALLIEGKLACMDNWRARQLKSGWLSEDVINEIYDMDVFVVSKYAPVNPDTSKDFCLSFNLAEVKLASCLSQVQRDAMLILKSYLKGIFRKYHERVMIDVDEKHDLKLTTFHLKTALYWLCEEKNKDGWNEKKDALSIVEDVLEFFVEAAGNKFLPHYFIASNLFAGFQEIDFNIIIGCIADIREDPVGSINDFFALDDGQPMFTEISLEEAICISNMSADGGKEQEMDNIEDAMIDFQRGCNDSKRDADGNAPIMKACKSTMQKILEDDSSGEAKLGAAILGICSDDVIQSVSNLISGSSRQTENARREFDKVKYMIKGFKF